MHHRMCHSTTTTTTPPTNTAINHSSDILTFYQKRVGINITLRQIPILPENLSWLSLTLQICTAVLSSKPYLNFLIFPQHKRNKNKWQQCYTVQPNQNLYNIKLLSCRSLVMYSSCYFDNFKKWRKRILTCKFTMKTNAYTNHKWLLAWSRTLSPKALLTIEVILFCILNIKVYFTDIKYTNNNGQVPLKAWICWNFPMKKWYLMLIFAV